MTSIKRLGPGDESILSFLAKNDAEFDVEGRGQPLEPLDAKTAGEYLTTPAVLFWAAFDGDRILGFLKCIQLPLRAGSPKELLLYEIGVRREARGKGTGRALTAQMQNWMESEKVKDVWVLADNPEAGEFYPACGFKAETPQPVYLLRSLE